MKTFKLLIFLLLPYYVYAHTINKECPLYDKKWECKDGLYRVLKWCEYNGHIIPLYGFVDKNDSVVVPIKYDYAEDMCNGFALIGTRDKTIPPLDDYSNRTPCYHYDYISNNNIILNRKYHYATNMSPIDSTVIIGVRANSKDLQMRDNPYYNRQHDYNPPSYVMDTYRVTWDEVLIGWWIRSDKYLHFSTDSIYKKPSPFDNILCDKLKFDGIDMHYEGFLIKSNGTVVRECDDKEIVLKRINDNQNYTSTNNIGKYSIVSKYGYVGIYSIDHRVKYVSVSYDALEPCGNDLFLALRNGTWGVINIKGEEIQPFIYSNILKTKRDGIYVLIKPTEDVRHDFHGGFVQVFEYGCMNEKGEIIVPVKHKGDMYDKSIKVGHPNLIFARDGLWSVYNIEGNFLCEPKYTGIYDGYNSWTHNYDLYDMQVLVEKDKKYGLMDKYGNIIIECIYDRLESIINGFAVVSLDGKHGIINAQGTIVLPIEYPEIKFSDNIISVKNSAGIWCNYTITGDQICTQ